MRFLTLLPMAFVMIAGPQILSSIFLATSENWRRNSVAYIAGGAVSITIVVTAAYFLIDSASGDGPSDTIYAIVLVLLVAAMVHVYIRRKESEPRSGWAGCRRRGRGSRSSSACSCSGCSRPTS